MTSLWKYLWQTQKLLLYSEADVIQVDTSGGKWYKYAKIHTSLHTLTEANSHRHADTEVHSHTNINSIALDETIHYPHILLGLSLRITSFYSSRSLTENPPSTEVSACVLMCVCLSVF